MENVPQRSPRPISRVFVVGVVGVLVVLGLILVIRLTAQPVVAELQCTSGCTGHFE